MARGDCSMGDELGRAMGGARRPRLWGTSMGQALPGASATVSGCGMGDELGRAMDGARRPRLWGSLRNNLLRSVPHWFRAN